MKSISIDVLGDRNKYRKLLLRNWEGPGVIAENDGHEVEKVEEKNKRMKMDGGEGL